MADVEDGKDEGEEEEEDDEDEDEGTQKKKKRREDGAEAGKREEEKESRPINKLRRGSRLFNLPLEASAALCGIQ